MKAYDSGFRLHPVSEISDTPEIISTWPFLSYRLGQFLLFFPLSGGIVA